MKGDSISKQMTASGIVHRGPCWLTDFFIDTDGANNPTIGIYDGVNTSGKKLFPSCEYDATGIGLNGAALPKPKRCTAGIYVDITTAGTCEVVIGFKPFC